MPRNCVRLLKMVVLYLQDIKQDLRLPSRVAIENRVSERWKCKHFECLNPFDA